MKPTKRDRREKRVLSADYLEPLVAALGDAGTLARVRVEELLPVAFQLALYFGTRRDPATSVVLGDLYERLLTDVTGEERAGLVEDLTRAIAAGSTTVLALLPVLQHERDAAIVRSAAMVFAMRMTPSEGDVLTGPRMIRTLIDHAEPDGVRAGLAGALLALGDARVKPLLEGLWSALPAAAVEALLALPRSLATRLEVEWLLDGLEDAEPARFARIAASLARLPLEGEGRVLEVEREWPVGPSGEALTVVREWSAEALGRELSDRLEGLERRAEAGAMAPVSVAFGRG